MAGLPGIGYRSAHSSAFHPKNHVGDKPRGWVPSWPIGTRHTEFAEHWNLPFEVTRGGKESLYPEYMKKIQEMMKAPPAKPTTE